jgi:hypothetical protein
MIKLTVDKSELNSASENVRSFHNNVHRIILVANKGFYGLNRQFRSQFLSMKNIVKLYNTLIRPVLAYGSETWVLSKSDGYFRSF